MRSVELILPASKSYLPGDFVVHRALPRRELRRVGGFVFLDHFDQPNITPELFDVPPHPHVGLQTVTYLYEGEILHTDSLDYQQKIVSGDVNWMTSGRGITHSEQVTELQPRVHGLQSWVGLPHDKRKIEPAFEHFSKDLLPKIEGAGFSMTVIAGDVDGNRSPIPTYQELVYIDIEAAAGTAYEFPVDPSHELAIYVCTGEVKVGDKVLAQHDLAKLSNGDHVAFEAVSDTKFVVIGGEPLPEPTVIYWNFITDTIGEAKQRYIDWEEGKFPPVRLYKKVCNYETAEDEEEVMKLL
jgi:redox-sensitive bicupin YhaK (pirin superfamily)